MSITDASRSNGTATTITIDRNQRKALLAAIDNRLSHYEPLYDAIGNHDRGLMLEARDEFAIIFPVLDAIDYYDESELRSAYTITPDAHWLHALIDNFEPGIVECIEDSTEQLAEILKEGDATFEPGGSRHTGIAVGAHLQFMHAVRDLRGLIAEDTDELAGVRSIRAALTADDDRPT